MKRIFQKVKLSDTGKLKEKENRTVHKQMSEMTRLIFKHVSTIVVETKDIFMKKTCLVNNTSCGYIISNRVREYKTQTR